MELCTESNTLILGTSMDSLNLTRTPWEGWPFQCYQQARTQPLGCPAKQQRIWECNGQKEKIICLRWWLFWQSQLRATDGHSPAPCSKGLCSRWQCPLHILPGLAPGPYPRDQCTGVQSKNPQLRYLSPVTPASFLPHVYVLCCTAVTFLLILY